MSTGTPDWQKPTQVLDSPIAAAPQENISGNSSFSTGWQAISTWSAVRINVAFQSGYGTVSVEFSEAGSAGVPAYNKTWNMNSSTSLYVIVPAYSNYVNVTVTNETGSTIITSVYVAACNIACSDIVYPNLGSGDYQNTVSIAAGATRIINPAFMYGGPATLSFTPDDTSGKISVTLQTIQPNGTVQSTAADLGKPTTPVVQRVSVPADLVQVTITNTDTTGHSCRAGLVRD